jgi:putative transposase
VGTRLVETAPKELSVRRCCELLNLNRSTLYYETKPAEFDDVDLLNRIRDIWERYPFYGYRRITKELRENHALHVPIIT